MKKNPTKMKKDTLILNALKSILRPTIRLAIHHGCILQMITDIIKEIYVEEASKSLASSGKVTDSQISIITGVHRKDVKAYRERIEQEITTQTSPSLSAEVIARWLGDSTYLDANGHPLALPYKSDASASFSLLASQVSNDVRPRALLDEMLRMNYVSVSPIDDTVILQEDALTPRESFVEKIHFLALSNGDHMQSAVHNIVSNGPKFFDRCVYHNDLSAESIEILKKMGSELSLKALKQVNQKAFELSKNDALTDKPKHRFTLGSYVFSEHQDTTHTKDSQC